MEWQKDHILKDPERSHHQVMSSCCTTATNLKGHGATTSIQLLMQYLTLCMDALNDVSEYLVLR